MEPIRSKARPRLAASSIRMEIQAKLASTTPCTPEFLDLAIAWADRHVSVLDRINEFDTSGERSSTTESVVVTAWLIARDGTNDLIRERGDWMRTVFIKAFAGNDEPSFVMRSGLSMNPRAIAFVGQTLLLHKDRRDDDFRLLLHFVVRSGYAAAHGFGVSIHALTTIHEHFVPAILRCAFLSAIMLDYGWRLTEEQKQVREREHQAVLDAGVNEIANWLERYHNERWREIADQIQLRSQEASTWPKLADAMATGFNSETLLFEQFAGYSEKEQLDLQQYEPRFAAVDVILGHKRVQQTNIVKQADVVMAMYLLWNEFSPDVRQANFRYYEPRTAHGSSLSPSIHALVAARLGEINLAARYLKQSAEMDLGNNMGNASGGIHAAAAGGLWQAAVFGFAGLHASSEGVKLSPHLLPHWRRLSFPWQWRSHHLRISIEQNLIQVNVTGPSSVKLTIDNGPEIEASPDQNYTVIREQNRWNAWHAA